MTIKKSQRESRIPSQEKPISLAPLDFESAVRAAMATGKPPKAKQREK